MNAFIRPYWSYVCPFFIFCSCAFRVHAYEAAGNATAANGVNKVWECYVAGISPTNEAARFEARIDFVGGASVVTWTPDLNDGGTKQERTYTIYGRESLTDGDWGPTNAASRFFRVKVGMP